MITGTIQATDADATITATNTKFSTELVAGDRVLFSDGTTGVVDSITSDTAFELTANKAGAIGAGAKIQVRPGSFNDSDSYYTALNAGGTDLVLPLKRISGFFRKARPYFPMMGGLEVEMEFATDASAIESPQSATVFSVGSVDLYYERTDFHPTSQKELSLKWTDRGKVVDGKMVKKSIPYRFKSYATHEMKFEANSTELAVDELKEHYVNLDRLIVARVPASRVNVIGEDGTRLTSAQFGEWRTEYANENHPRFEITSTKLLHEHFFKNLGAKCEVIDSCNLNEYEADDLWSKTPHCPVVQGV